MDNKKKYDQSFMESFSIEQVDANLTYDSIPEWDSIGHMALISALEDAFGISMETDDIVEFSSYAKGIEIMKKYKVEI